MSNIQVTKRDGSKEAIDLEKLHKVAFYACEGITYIFIMVLQLMTSKKHLLKVLQS
jgi:ribonucleoside-diphosphate reductase alpha chain